MGAKFRITPSVSKAKIWNSIKESILNLKKRLSKQGKIKENNLDLWHDMIMKKIKKRFYSFKNYELESNDIFKQDNVKRYLQTLHDRFVIVPVDKASNSFAIICKQIEVNWSKSD